MPLSEEEGTLGCMKHLALVLFRPLQDRDHSGTSQLQDPVGPKQLISKNHVPSLKGSMLDQQKLCEFIDFSTTVKKTCTDSVFFTLCFVGSCFKTVNFFQVSKAWRD